LWQESPRSTSGLVYDVDAPQIGDSLRVTVVEPFPGAAALQRRFPAIYVLDPSAILDIVVGAKRLFDIFSGGALPLTYFIGIGYADADIEARRFRDFTPTAAPLPSGLKPPLTFGLGGATRYLDVIRNEIIPELEARHPLDPGQRALVGYSLSGLFAAHVLFERPETFERYLVISPSLWWDEARIFRDEEAWQATHGDLGAKVFFVGGAAEEEPGGGWRNNLPDEVVLPLKLVSNLRRLGDRLAARNYPSLRVKTAFIPDGRHISVFPAAVGFGLIELFGL
jgi:predicted alpha/beta superfamily hydrolase